MKLSKLALATAFAAGLTVTTAEAANWLALQGTEPAGSSDRAKLWGFIQPQYTYIKDTELKAGPFNGEKLLPNQVGPDRKSSNTFQLRRARIGVRGTNFPLDSKTNYFLLIEAGRNGITRFSSDVAATDASVTLNHIPGARVRIGQFKTPTAEEGLQAIHVFDYINFTNMTDQLMLERFSSGDGTEVNVPNGPIQSVGAFRDIGVQVFDMFKRGNWEHSYAAMVGNGNGLNRADNNNDKDTYLYWSSERIYAGKGARRQGWKMFAWRHDGNRTLDFANGVAGKQDFNRDRWGIGTTFRKGKWRAAAEYIKADGLIRNGSDGGAVPGTTNGGGTTASLNFETDAEADGWYVHAGYAVTPKVELDIRYDFLDRISNDNAKQREFETLTLGAQYFFNKKTRAVVNYEIRSQDAPGFASSAAPNQIAESLENRLSLQVLAIF